MIAPSSRRRWRGGSRRCRGHAAEAWRRQRCHLLHGHCLTMRGPIFRRSPAPPHRHPPQPSFLPFPASLLHLPAPPVHLAPIRFASHFLLLSHWFSPTSSHAFFLLRCRWRRRRRHARRRRSCPQLPTHSWLGTRRKSNNSCDVISSRNDDICSISTCSSNSCWANLSYDFRLRFAETPEQPADSTLRWEYVFCHLRPLHSKKCATFSNLSDNQQRQPKTTDPTPGVKPLARSEGSLTIHAIRADLSVDGRAGLLRAELNVSWMSIPRRKLHCRRRATWQWTCNHDDDGNEQTNRRKTANELTNEQTNGMISHQALSSG